MHYYRVLKHMAFVECFFAEHQFIQAFCAVLTSVRWVLLFHTIYCCYILLQSYESLRSHEPTLYIRLGFFVTIMK